MKPALALILALPLAAQTLLLTSDELTRVAPPRETVLKNAASALKAKPFSVTAARPAHLDISRNAYYSEGPYWWPDPNNPNGPYIRKDGERYPGRFIANRDALGDMTRAVLALSIAAHLERNDPRYAAHAQLLLRTWFLDPQTRMEPHLEYGQSVRGRNDGRGAGIIDTASLIQVCEAALILESLGHDQAPLKAWFRDYSKWLTTSKKGQDEMKAKNNHGAWWTAQLAAYSIFSADKSNEQLAWRRYREEMIPGHFEASGAAPLEEARTRSLSYSAMNLDAFALLCRMAERRGVSLWGLKNSKGAGLETAARYLAPHLKEPSNWKLPQIDKYDPSSTLFPGLLASGLRDPQFRELFVQLPRATSPWVVWVDAAARTPGRILDTPLRP